MQERHRNLPGLIDSNAGLRPARLASVAKTFLCPCRGGGYVRHTFHGFRCASPAATSRDSFRAGMLCGFCETPDD